MPKRLRDRDIPDPHQYPTRFSRQTRNPGTNIANHVRVDDLPALVDVHAVENRAALPRTSVLPGGNVRTSGGWVRFRGITNGQRDGVEAVITRSMIRRGSNATYNFPFFIRRTGYLIVRGHLLARVLGGSGQEARNLVPLYHSRNNLPMYRDLEHRIQDFVEDGNVAHVIVTPEYDYAYPDPLCVFPSRISIEAWDEFSGRNVLSQRTVTFSTGFRDT